MKTLIESFRGETEHETEMKICQFVDYHLGTLSDSEMSERKNRIEKFLLGRVFRTGMITKQNYHDFLLNSEDRIREKEEQIILIAGLTVHSLKSSFGIGGKNDNRV